MTASQGVQMPWRLSLLALATVLVLTGSTAAGDVDRHPYRPSLIAASVGELATQLR